MQIPDHSPLVFGSKPSSSSSFQEIVGYASEQLSTSGHCSNPDDSNSEINNLGSWNLKLMHDSLLPGAVLSICKYLEDSFLASAGNIVR